MTFPKPKKPKPKTTRFIHVPKEQPPEEIRDQVVEKKVRDQIIEEYDEVLRKLNT